jgi:hypothetical protein
MEEEFGQPAGFDHGAHYCRPLPNSDVLLCIRDLAKNYGRELEARFSKPPGGHDDTTRRPNTSPPPGSAPGQRATPGLGSIHMYTFIGSLFYFGFKKPLIDCLKELSTIQGGQYRLGIQAKLMNTIYIILTKHVDFFPVQQMFATAKRAQEDERRKQRQKRHRNPASGRQAEERKSAAVVADSPGFRSPLLSDSQQPSESSARPSRDAGHDASRGGTMLMPGQIEEESKDSLSMPSAGTSIYSDKYIEEKKIENLKAILDINTQMFTKHLVEGIRDPKQAKKATKQELEDIRTESGEMVTLALRALYTFGHDDIGAHFDILQFMSESVLPYLFDENASIRCEAVQTFSNLQLKLKDQHKLSPRYEQQVNKLLHKFFVTAMTDPDISIRIAMLTTINPDFDPFIARYESLLMLFNCMKDSNNEVKIKTIKILGRLSNINPQQILPYLRNLIVSLISQLEHSQQYKEREEAAKLIKAFVKYNRDLSKSYILSILNCLFQRIDQD